MAETTSIDKGIFEHTQVHTTCTARCCSSLVERFQPVDKATLDMIASEKRNFQPQWYKQFFWLTVCLTYKRVFCLYCRYAAQHNMLSFTKMGETAFTEAGFKIGFGVLDLEQILLKAANGEDC